jgi:hypothetical protein
VAGAALVLGACGSSGDARGAGPGADATPLAAAHALVLLAGATVVDDGTDLAALGETLRDRLVTTWDPATGTWPSAGGPPEVITAAAVAALGFAGTWPEAVDAARVLDAAVPALRARLATLDPADPAAVPDLLPWVAVAAMLRPLDPDGAGELLAAAPVEAACATAAATPPVDGDGFAVDPVHLAAIEIAIHAGDLDCLAALRDAVPVERAALEAGLVGDDAVWHLRAVHDLGAAEFLPVDDVAALEATALAHLAAQPWSAFTGRLAELAPLVPIGVVGLELPFGVATNVIVPSLGGA